MLIDGEAGNSIPLDDRGLAYGDGLFETIAVLDGRPALWSRHITRLQRDAARLGLLCPAPDLWLSDILRLHRENPAARVVAKLILTRGGGGRGYTPTDNTRCRRITLLSPWPTWPDSLRNAGVSVRVCTFPLGCSPGLAGIKHLNRLEQVMASRELAQFPAVQEGLMQDTDGHLIEGTRTNLFLVEEDELLTPILDRNGVRGVMREAVIAAAVKMGLRVREQRIPLRQLADVKEMFLCNSLIGLWPVATLVGEPGREFRLGAVTRQLQSLTLETGR